MSHSQAAKSIAYRFAPLAVVAISLMGCQTVDPTVTDRPLGIFAAPRTPTALRHADEERSRRNPQAAESPRRRPQTVAGQDRDTSRARTAAREQSRLHQHVASATRRIGLIMGIGF
jgi:hypothetical protein